MAFDSVHVEALLDALRRFGLAQDILDMVRGLLYPRRFRVKECGAYSEARPKKSGISQGCTLSPILFLVLMSVLLSDAQDLLPEPRRLAKQNGNLAELLYADDTLLYGIEREHLEQYLAAIVTAGRRYGMELHAGKSQVLSVGCAADIRTPSGDSITTGPKLNYLGALLTDEGGAGQELSRRIGLAKAEFDLLARVWRHAGLSQRKKLEIYSSIVESRLLYGLSTVCLTVAEQRRLDGFQCRCLRRIWGIKPAFFSRVSNADAWALAGHPRATSLLTRRQSKLFQRILALEEGHPLRAASFIRGTNRPATDEFVRRRGRPSKEWVIEAMKLHNVSRFG